MSIGFLALYIAASAAAQNPMYGAEAPPAASTQAVAASTAAVSASSSTAPSDDASGRGFKVGGEEPKPKLARPLHAVIHKDAVDWEPVGLREGGIPGSSQNMAALKVVKVKGRMKGDDSKARSVARLHKGKKDSVWLVISLYPKALERRRTHFELRFRVFEGFVEDVEAAAVTVTDRRRQKSDRLLDSWDLRDQAIEYESERPGSGQLVVAELDPRPGSAARNSGRLEKAEFAHKDLGFVNLSWSVRGLKALGK